MKIDCSRDASLFINAVIQAHSSKWIKINNTQLYLMEYQRPVAEELRKEKKITWQNNWNYGKGRMLIEQGVISNVNDLKKALSMIEIDFVQFNESKHKSDLYIFLLDENLRYQFANTIAEVFADSVEGDCRFHDFLTAIEYSAHTFGYAPIIRDKFTYLGRPVSLDNIGFEDRTEIYQIFNWVVFDSFKGEQLIQKVDKIKKLGLTTTLVKGDDGEEYNIYENGWIKEGIEEIFFKILEQNDEIKEDVKEGKLQLSANLSEEGELRITTWEDVELIRQHKGTTWLGININNIFIAKIFTTESDGSICVTYAVSEQGLLTEEVAEGEIAYSNMSCNQYLLFQKRYKNAPYSSLLNIVKEFGVRSSLYIQDIQGVSKQVVEESFRYDTKKNAIEDKLLIQGGIILSKVDPLQDASMEVHSAYTFLPEGVQIAPNQIKIELGDHVQSIIQDEQDFQKRISHYNPKIELSNRPTKDEVQLQGAQHKNNRESKIPSKFVDYSILFYNILKDIVDEDFENPIDVDRKNYFYDELLAAFKQYNIKRADLDKILASIRSVQIHPVNIDIQAIQTAMPFAQNTVGRNKLIRSFLIALGFSRRDVNQFVKIIDYGYQIEQAANENAAFYNTSEVVFDESQDHIGHLNIHFPKIDRTVKGIQGGEDIVKGFHYITNALTNTEKHVESLRTSYFFKNRYKEFKAIQDHFVGVAKQISEIIQKKKEENAQKGDSQDMSIPPDVLGKIKILEWQAQQKNARTNWLTEQAAQRKMKEFEMRLKMKAAEAQQDSDIKQKFADLQGQLEQVKAAVKLSTNGATT